MRMRKFGRVADIITFVLMSGPIESQWTSIARKFDAYG